MLRYDLLLELLAQRSAVAVRLALSTPLVLAVRDERSTAEWTQRVSGSCFV